MEAIEKQLEELQKELEENRAETASVTMALQDAKKALAEANRRRKELTASVESLQREANVLKEAQAAIEVERAAAKDKIGKARPVLVGLLAQLDKELDEKHRKAIKESVESVDSEIAGLKSRVEELGSKAAKAENGVAAAKIEVANSSTAFQDVETQLRNLPRRIKTLAGQVSSLRSAAQAAADEGRKAKAFYLLGELERALEQLEQLTESEQEEALTNRLMEQRRKANEARDGLEAKIKNLDQLRQDLAAAEREVLAKEQGRDKAIQERLEAISVDEEEPTEG
jgi:chromosome segregation ATPase